MNKKVKFAMAVAAIAVAGGIGIYASQSEKQVSDVTLANIEALADNEGGGTCRWSRVYDSFGVVYWNCVYTGSGDFCVCGSTMG